MNPKIKILMEHEFPLITCLECGQRFILLAILGDGDWAMQYMGQTSGPNLTGNSGYCPYCGKEIKNEPK
jgi:hypothetical protein